MPDLSLRSVLGHAYGFWNSAILATGLRHRVFDHIAAGADTPQKLAAAAGISPRGSQALLDGLIGLGLLQRTAGSYTNAPHVAAYLLSESRDYIGGYADMILATMADWARLPDSVVSGAPLHSQERADPGNSFWESLVRALAPLSFPPARAAAERLKLRERDAFRMLDIGGGAGGYSVAWLDINPNGRCEQLDWPNVNAVAREYVTRFGHAERFSTIDGDMEHVELADGSYDYAIYSNVAHGLSEARNTAMFRKIRRWLKPEGTLVISSLMPSDERTGDALLMMFSSNLLLNSEQGTTHLRRDYVAWLHAGGFRHIDFEPVIDLPFTLIYAS